MSRGLAWPISSITDIGPAARAAGGMPASEIRKLDVAPARWA